MAAEVLRATPCWINCCVERKREERWLWGGTKPESEKKDENFTVCWACKVFVCLLKSVKCSLCVQEQIHTHTSFVWKQLCILLCVWVDPDDSRGKLSVREGQLRQAEGWAAAASGLGHSLFMVQTWAFTDHCHSLTHTHMYRLFHSITLHDWERLRRGGKGRDEKKRWKMDAKICHAWRTEMCYTQECIPRNKVTVNFMFPAGHKIGIMASRKHYIYFTVH